MRYLISFILLLYTIGTYASEITPIDNFDSNKYLGKWYEIARLPNRFEQHCRAPISATYSTNPDNPQQIFVVNQCTTLEHKPSIANGVANFVESTNLAKLKVTFLPTWLRWLNWLSLAYGDYWVIYTDYNNLAIVGSPDHEYLWVLARNINISQEQLDEAKKIASQQGFAVDKLIINNTEITQP
ncbi:MAG: hypothetical protein RLZZ293_660 [Pseudomonadota bacterium]|jgi:apolipoprotein D and lipocalin family protein